jgi:diguanylate cyclase
MERQEDQQKSAEYMRLAIPLMTKNGIQMTPENYAVWYEYISGGNMVLSEVIDMDIAEHGAFSNQRTKELYDRFWEPEKNESKLHEQKTGLRHVLTEVLKYAKTGASAASESTNQLAEALAKLHPEMTQEQIHDVIIGVMKETEQAMSSSQLLTDRLNSAMADIDELKLDIEDTKKQAKTDRLTGLANRKSFDDYIRKIVAEAEQSEQQLTVIFCDLDHFRELNAIHGHLVGDQVLKVIANILKSQLKGRDFVARYGGEEFTITLINTSMEDARQLAETIREEVSNKRIQRKDSKEPLGQITMSFGIAAYWQTEGVDSFLQRADRALYHSKRKGRNITSEAHPPII